MSEGIAWRDLDPVRFVVQFYRSGQPLWLKVFLSPMFAAALLLWPVFVAAPVPFLLLQALARSLPRYLREAFWRKFRPAA